MRILAPALLVLLGALSGRSAVAEDGPSSKGPTDAERAEVRKLVDELRAEASRLRGLPWKHDVPADLLSRDQMIEHFVKDIDEEYTPEERARDDKILRRMGLLQPGEDAVGLELELVRDAVQGFFDPKVDKLFLIAGVSAEAQKPAILHELIHALEHQHYDLEARVRLYEDGEPNRLFAEKCLEEGSAEHARSLFEKEHPEAAERAEREQVTAQTLAAQLAMLDRVPAYMILQTMFQYQYGPALVGRFVRDDYAKRMDLLYVDPPTTEEQWLHPEKWFAAKRDLEQRVVWAGDLAAAAGPGWKKLYETTAGELDLVLFLDYHLGNHKGRIDRRGFARSVWAHPRAINAGVGWDGGREVYLEKEGLPIGHVSAFAFDSVRDAVQAGEALVRALRAFYGDRFEERGDARADGLGRVDWASPNGRGRLVVRGTHVVLVDGFPDDRFEAMWTVAEKTRFERQPGDAFPLD